MLPNVKSVVNILKFVIPTLLVVSFTAFLITFSSQAAPLAAVYLHLSRIQANLNGTSGQEIDMVLAIRTGTAISSGGSIEITFPDAHDGQWCRTAGTVTVVGVTSSPVDMSGTNWDISAALPSSGTLAAQCYQGSGAGSADRIVITNVGALATNTTYGVKVSNGSPGILGTATNAGQLDVTVMASEGDVVDSKTFEITLVSNDRVVVSATVSSVPTVNCSISTNTVDLGILFPGGAHAVGTHTITVSTTGEGYYWSAYGTGNGSNSGLWKSSATTYLIQSGPTATLQLNTPGAEGFGLTVSDPGGSATVPTNFVSTVAGQFGTLGGSGSSNAKLILYKNGSQATPVNSTITYGARAGTSAEAGSYQETVTFVCGGYY
jgi:hypothetical protein